MGDHFGVDSLNYLTAQWRSGERFCCCLSSSQDFLAKTDIQEEVFTPVVVMGLFLQAPRAPWLSGQASRLRTLIADRQPIHFFKDPTLLPADVDCTAYAYSVALKMNLISPAECAPVAELVAQNVAEEGVLQVYFDRDGDRDGIIDPAVCINALYLLNQLNLVNSARPSEHFVRTVLERGDFENGTRYYPSPDTFLYFLSRLVTAFPLRYGKWTPRVISAVRSRIGLDSRPIELAQRILAATALGVDAALDTWKLQRERYVDGSFRADALFRFGRTPRYFGGETVTTAFAARALIDYNRALRFGAWRTKMLRQGNPHGVYLEAPTTPVDPLAAP